MIEDFEFEHKADGIVVTKYLGNSEIVKVPAYVNNVRVYGIGGSCFQNNDKIKMVIIPNTINYIAEYAFADCDGLTNIAIPKSVQKINDGAFACCSRLTNLTIPYSVKYIGEYTFYGCYNLTNITLEEGIENIGMGAFESCNSLKSVKIPKSVAFIDGAPCGGCRGLTEMLIDKDSKYFLLQDSILFDKSKTELIQYSNKSSKVSYEIPCGIRNISSGAFQYSKLSSITIPDSVEYIGEKAFAHCLEITNLKLPKNVTTVDLSAFLNTVNLTDIFVFNKSCDLELSDISALTTIHGYANSEAEYFAKDNGYKFEVIN